MIASSLPESSWPVTVTGAWIDDVAQAFTNADTIMMTSKFNFDVEKDMEDYFFNKIFLAKFIFAAR